jgi:NAD(P)H-hydrate repair Nnr-like enzyme with NAD(P)H-hydrate dehydratase domain
VLQGQPVDDCIVEAAVNACELVRVAQRHAFAEQGRSMVASDIVRCLQRAVAECWP